MWGREEREEERRGERIERRQWRRECEAQRVSFLSLSPLLASGRRSRAFTAGVWEHVRRALTIVR